MEVLFRKATIDDVEAIIELCNECFNENTSLDYAKRVFIQTENDENQIYLVGVVDNRIVAHAKITVIPTIYEKMNCYSILNHVCVKPEFRRHNLATKMLIECERISKEKNCVAMELWSMNYRQAAHECYKRYGFNLKEAGFFSKKIN